MVVPTLQVDILASAVIKRKKKSLQQLLRKGTEPCPLHSANCIEIFNEVEKFDTH